MWSEEISGDNEAAQLSALRELANKSAELQLHDLRDSLEQDGGD